MAIVIVQQPDTLSLSGNLKDLVVQTGSALQVTLSTGSDTVLDETYYPGNGNLVHLNFSDVINAYLAYSLPNTDIYLQTKLSAAFTVSLTNNTDNKTLSFSAIKGGKLHLNESASQFLKGNFLTWQPNLKPVTYYSPEWLTYYAPSACSIILKAYWEDGSTSTKTLVSPSAGYCYSINLQYAVVSGMFDGKRPMYYDVWVESGGARLTYVQRYVASELQADNEHWFLFENSLGGMDSVRVYGSQTDDPDYDYHMALRGNEGENYRIDVERVRSVNTGYLTPEETRWLQDLFATRKAYVYTATGLYPIILTTGDGTTEGDDEPSSFSFGYRFADVRPYLDIQRRTDLPENLTIPVPTGETFFLPPRLAEFPKQELSPDLLIPVEEPHTEAWGTLTAGMLHDSVLNGLIAYLDGLTVQPYYQNLIKVGDTTTPTDFNVFSAARTLKEIESLAGSSKPSALWEIDKSEEYLSLSEDGLTALLTKTLAATGDVVAYGDENYTPTLPIASPSNYGLVKYDGTTLKVDDDGRLYVAGGGGSGSGSGSGISNVLPSGTGNAVTSLSFDPSTNILTYNLGATYIDKTALDSALLNYVTISTDQVITGKKIFTEDLLSNKDVIAYASGEDLLPALPIASYDTYGLVKIDNVTIKEDDRGRIYVASGGSSGIDFTVGAGLELTPDKYLNVLFGTTSNTACAGNDARLSDARRNPYSLSWSGYSNGSYNGSSSASITIPSNTNQLTNGAGYIYDTNGNISSLTGSGNSSQYLAGNGRFYTIAYSELSGKPDLTVYMPKAGGVFTGNVDMNTGGLYPYYRVTNTYGHAQLSGTYATVGGSTITGLIQCTHAFAIMGYDNYPNMVIFDRGNLKATGDVIAFATSANNPLPISTPLVYGLIKYDDETLKVNEYGQLYAVSSSSEDGGVVTSVVISGSGNVITNATFESGVLTITKGSATGGTSVSWGTSYTNYVGLNVGGTTKNISLNGHTHSGYLTEHQDIYSLSIILNGTTYTYTPNSSSKTITINTSGGTSGDWVDRGSTQTIYGDKSFTSQQMKLSSHYYHNRYSDNNVYIHFYESSSDTSTISTAHFRTAKGGTFYDFYMSGQTGNFFAPGSVTQGSDIRIKNVIGDFGNVLDNILNLNAVYYTYKDDLSSIKRIGFIAQNVMEYYPEVVSINEETGYYNLSYTDLSVIAIQGVKELYRHYKGIENSLYSIKSWGKTKDDQILYLQKRVDELQSELDVLKGGAA